MTFVTDILASAKEGLVTGIKEGVKEGIKESVKETIKGAIKALFALPKKLIG